MKTNFHGFRYSVDPQILMSIVVQFLETFGIHRNNDHEFPYPWNCGFHVTKLRKLILTNIKETTLVLQKSAVEIIVILYLQKEHLWHYRALHVLLHLQQPISKDYESFFCTYVRTFTLYPAFAFNKYVQLYANVGNLCTSICNRLLYVFRCLYHLHFLFFSWTLLCYT